MYVGVHIYSDVNKIFAIVNQCSDNFQTPMSEDLVIASADSVRRSRICLQK